LPWLVIVICGSKLSFYLNIFIAILCAKMSRVTCALYSYTIKRKNILIILSQPWVLMTSQGNILTKLNPRYVRVFKRLPSFVNLYLCLKIIKLQNIFLSQYCVQKYSVRLSPKRKFQNCSLYYSQFFYARISLFTFNFL